MQQQVVEIQLPTEIMQDIMYSNSTYTPSLFSSSTSDDLLELSAGGNTSCTALDLSDSETSTTTIWPLTQTRTCASPPLKRKKTVMFVS